MLTSKRASIKQQCSFLGNVWRALGEEEASQGCGKWKSCRRGPGLRSMADIMDGKLTSYLEVLFSLESAITALDLHGIMIKDLSFVKGTQQTGKTKQLDYTFGVKIIQVV